MGTLNDKILSSEQRPFSYNIQPYMATEGLAEYRQRVYLALQPWPVVDALHHSTANTLSTEKPAPVAPMGVSPVIFNTGVPQVRGVLIGQKGGY